MADLSVTYSGNLTRCKTEEERQTDALESIAESLKTIIALLQGKAA